MVKFVRRLWTEEEGQDLAEYGLLLAAIGIAAVVAVGLLGDQIVLAFQGMTDAIAPIAAGG